MVSGSRKRETRLGESWESGAELCMVNGDSKRKTRVGEG